MTDPPTTSSTLPAAPSPPPSAPQAWTAEQVFRQFGPRVFTLARRMLGNDADAEDVAQDVLLQVVRKLDHFRGDAELMTWLHRVTVNAAMHHRRKRTVQQEHESHDPLDNYMSDGYPIRPARPWSITPDAVLENRETSKLIERAIDRLPEKYRDVYLLADVEGMPNATIGDVLGLSLSAVKSRLHRGRLLMRDTLAPHFEGMPL